MASGKPEFHEGYANPDAPDAVVQFDYAAIDGVTECETEMQIIADAVVRIFSQITAGRKYMDAPQYIDEVSKRAINFGYKVGLRFGSIDIRYLQQYVGSYTQAAKLGHALRRVFGTILSGDNELNAYNSQIGNRIIALVWIVAPSLFDGMSLKALADYLQIHPVTLSGYAADMSREFGIRSVGQRKGWNWRPDKTTKQDKAKKQPQEGL